MIEKVETKQYKIKNSLVFYTLIRVLSQEPRLKYMIRLEWRFKRNPEIKEQALNNYIRPHVELLTLTLLQCCLQILLCHTAHVVCVIKYNMLSKQTFVITHY